MKFNKKIWLSPIVFFGIYLGISVLIYIIGPWPWPTSNQFQLVMYLIFSQLIILFGYLMGWKRTKKILNCSGVSDQNVQIRRGIKFLKISLIISAVLLIPTSLSRTGEILPNIFEGIVNPGLVYNQNFERLSGGNQYIYVEYIRLFFSIFLISLWPLTVVYWSHLSIFLRSSCAVIILANLSIYIATGTNKGLADFIITLPWLLFLANNVTPGGLRISRLKLIISGFTLLCVFLILFTFGQLQRSGWVAERGVMNLGSELIYADSEYLQPFLSENVIRGYESLARYLGAGYYALSLAMQVDSSSTLGLGSSMFIARNANALFDTNFFIDQSLPGILEDKYSYSYLQLWHSIYTWLASDFGFFGSALLLSLLAYFLGVSWGASLIRSDALMITFLYMLLIIFYYIPANNQVFQTGETCIGFIVIVIALLIRKLNIKFHE